MQGMVLDNPDQLTATPRLVQLSGANSGASFLIRGFRTTIGRSESNHIVIQDESVSRVHAIIEKNEDGTLIIVDNQSRNGIAVNGVKKEMSLVQAGDQITLGSVQLKLEAPKLSSLSVNNQFDKELSSGPEIRKGIRINKRILIYGGLALVLTLVLVNPDSDSKKENDKEKAVSNPGQLKINVSPPPKLGGPPEATQQNKVIDLTKSELDEEIERLSSLDGSVADSEVHFRRGQRDFFNKNYHRAINSLELAISLNRTHPSASYYLQSAIHEAEREAAKNLEVGIKYFAALQYKRAIYHFKQVQSLLAHKKEDPVLKKCAEYIRLSEERLKVAELYP